MDKERKFPRISPFFLMKDQIYTIRTSSFIRRSYIEIYFFKIMVCDDDYSSCSLYERYRIRDCRVILKGYRYRRHCLLNFDNDDGIKPPTLLICADEKCSILKAMHARIMTRIR